MRNCYVYLHLNAEGEVCYVGFGRGPRCLTTHKRSKEHKAFIEERFSEVGLEFVKIVFKNGTEKECRELEARLIKELKPRFNKQMNGASNAGRGSDNHNARFTPQEVEEHRRRFSEWKGSMRAYHREHLNHVAFSTALKLLKGISYAAD